jgi:hypothetical protein
MADAGSATEIINAEGETISVKLSQKWELHITQLAHSSSVAWQWFRRDEFNIFPFVGLASRRLDA